MLSLGKTACDAKPSQKNRRGLRLQAQPGFAASSCARRRPRKTPAPVPDADATLAFCMHGINKKGLPTKTGQPFYLFSDGDGGNRTYRKPIFLRYFEAFAVKMQAIEIS